MPRTRFALPVALALPLAAMLLTGCAVTSVAVETTQGLPERHIAGDNLFNGVPLAMWVGGGLAVVTFGSSSCPPVPTSIAAPDAEHVVIEFAASPDTPCSADLAPTTHQFDLPSGVSATPGVTAELRFGEQVYEVPVD
jgi:hypothetical protein